MSTSSSSPVVSCLSNDGKKFTGTSQSGTADQHFEAVFGAWLGVIFYGLFLTAKRQASLLKQVLESLKNFPLPFHRLREIPNPHLTLAHVKGYGSYDGDFIVDGMDPNKLNIKTVFVKCKEIVCNDKLITLVLDPTSVPYCQSVPPHITLATFVKIDLKDDPGRAIADPASYRVPFTDTLSMSLNCISSEL